MRNKISIDELVRQKVAQGEEPHNLGAWANMERMLNGQNPYQEKEEKKRRPWMFLLLGALLCSTAVIGGYNYLSNNDGTSTVNQLAKTPSNTEVPTQEATHTTNNRTGEPTISNQNSATPALASANNASTASIEAIKEIEKQNKLKQQSNTTINNSQQSSSKQDKTVSSIMPPRSKTSLNNSAPKLANNVKKNTDNAKLADQATVSKPELLKPADDLSKNALSKKSPPANKNNIPPTISESYYDTIQVTEVSQKFKEDEFGQKRLMSDSFNYSIVKQKKRTVVNPRFVELTQEQEAAAQRRTALASAQANVPTSTPSEIMASANKENNMPAKAKAVSDNTTIATKKENKSFFTLFKQAGSSINQKLVNITHTKYPIYTGMFVGLNAALINSKHNFVGFQGGFSAMTPLSRLLTLQAEARFMHQNNSGYTIKDSKNTIQSTFVDSTSIFKTKIYNYEIDSISYGYNLTNFYSMQIPITLNANFEKFNVYAGAHLNYGFRMNINTASNSFAVAHADTVATSATYQPRANTATQFTRDDFASRLGLGYTLGAAYNINSQLSLDLRMSNLFWDNTKGATKQEISDVFFRIPSFQLSIGYRFRAYEKAP